MFCKNCGKEIKGNEKFCPHCGQAVEEKRETQKMADVNEQSIKNQDDIARIKQEQIKLREKKRKSKKWIFIIPVLVIIIGATAVFFLANGDSDKKETIQKLLQAADLYKTDNSYVFNYQGKWEIIYTEGNSFAKITEQQVSHCVEETFGIADAANDGTFSYDFDTENLNMYFDTDIPDGKLSIITYNLEKDKFTLNVDGDRYEPTDEFAEYLDSYKLADTLKEDVSVFKRALNQMELSVEQVGALSFSDIEKNIDSKDIGSEKQLIVEETTDSEGQKEPEDIQDIEKEEKMRTEYIFPDSDKKYLSEDEVRSVDTEKMALGRNEIFARHGYIFTNETYAEYFESKSWYQGTVSADQFNADQEFNDFEKKNVELIKRIENEVNGTQNDFIGREGSYICTDSNLDVTGRIELRRTGTTFDFCLDTLETGYDLLTGSAEIVDSNTIQITTYGITITCTWSDSEHMYVTCSDVYQGMDGALMDDTTNGRNYVYSTEFS